MEREEHGQRNERIGEAYMKEDNDGDLGQPLEAPGQKRRRRKEPEVRVAAAVDEEE